MLWLATFFWTQGCSRDVTPSPTMTGAPAPTRTPTNTPAHEVAPTSSPIPTTPTTITPVTEASPSRPVPTKRSVSVAMTEREVVDRALAYLDPKHDPAIDLVQLVTGHQLNELSIPPLAYLFQTRVMNAPHAWVAPNSNSAIYIVIASTAPKVSALTDLCMYEGYDGRNYVMIAFDAATGEEIGGEPITARWSGGKLAYRTAHELIQRLARVEPPVIDIEGSERARHRRASSTPRWPRYVSSPPTPTPEATTARPFDAGLLSPTALEALQTYPLGEGAWWSYELVNRHMGYIWERATVTNTIVAATMTEFGARFEFERQLTWEFPTDVLHETPWGLRNSALDHVPLHRTMTENGILDPRSVVRSGVETVEMLALDESLKLAAASHLLTVVGKESVTTPAGTFRDCTHLFLIESAGSGTDSWFCPGVGFVRYKSWACYTNANELGLLELTDWSGR